MESASDAHPCGRLRASLPRKWAHSAAWADGAGAGGSLTAAVVHNDAATQSDFAGRPARVLSDEDLLDDGLQEAGALCNDERLVVGELSTLVAEGLLVFVVLGDKAGDAVGEIDQVFAQVFGFGVEFRFVTHEIAEDVHEDFEILGAVE